MSAFFERLRMASWIKKKKYLVLVHIKINDQTIQQLQLPCESRTGYGARRDAEEFVRKHLTIRSVESKIMKDGK